MRAPLGPLAPVLFRVAGGPRLGFGHIVRALSLAKAMQVNARLSVRGTDDAKRVAARQGAAVEEEGLATVLERRDVRLVVIDDPHARAAAAALDVVRRHRVPVASIHDLGLAPIATDLAIDGSLAPMRRSWPAGELLLGPRYMVLDPTLLQEIAAHRRVLAPGVREACEDQRVLVSLGGGPRIAAGLTIARAIADAYPQTRVTLAAGFSVRTLPTGHPRVRVLESPGVLRCELARADVAVLAGGVTLYESAALGVPAVAVAVVPAQWTTIRAFDRVGAARAAGLLHASSRERAPRVIARVVKAVGELLANEEALSAMALKAQEQVDGRGALRVATALRQLMEHGTASDAPASAPDGVVQPAAGPVLASALERALGPGTVPAPVAMPVSEARDSGGASGFKRPDAAHRQPPEWSAV